MCGFNLNRCSKRLVALTAKGVVLLALVAVLVPLGSGCDEEQALQAAYTYMGGDGGADRDEEVDPWEEFCHNTTDNKKSFDNCILGVPDRD